MGFDFGWTKPKTYLQLAGGGNTTEMVFLSAGTINCLCASTLTLSKVCLRSLWQWGKLCKCNRTHCRNTSDWCGGKEVSDSCWVTYVVSVPCLAVCIPSWCEMGHKMFERRCLHVVFWQCMMGLDSPQLIVLRCLWRACVIVLIACGAIWLCCASQCITPETKGKQAVGLLPSTSPGTLTYCPC